MPTPSCPGGVLDGVPFRLREQARMVLCGDEGAGDAWAVACLELASMCQSLQPPLVAALAGSHDDWVRAMVASSAAGPDEVLLGLAADPAHNVRGRVLQNRNAPAAVLVVAVAAYLDTDHPPTALAYALMRAATHPAADDAVLEALPAATVAAYRPERLAGPVDGPEVAELVSCFAAGDPRLVLAEARLRARAVLGLRP